MFTPLGVLSQDEMGWLAALASRATWRDIPGRQYRTAEITGHWEPCRRSFFILLPPRCVIERHRDSVPGITHHMVLQTNPACLNWWQEDGQDCSIHMETGGRYLAERSALHWAVNDGETDRIHLLVEYG